MSRVFVHKRKIYLWVLDHRGWSVAPTVLLQSWCELILLWSLVSFNVVIVILLLWHWRGYELVFCSEFFNLVFAMLFSFMFFTFVFVLFRGDEDEWWLCSSFVIWYENLEFGFFDWKHGFFSSDVVMLDAYLDSTWLVLSRGGKNIHAHGYPWVKSVTGTGRVAKRVSTSIINGYLITHYYMVTDTDLIVPILDNKLSKLLKYPYIYYLIT